MVHDVRETKRIRMKMLTQDVSLKELPYREMETIILVSESHFAVPPWQPYILCSRHIDCVPNGTVSPSECTTFD